MAKRPAGWGPQRGMVLTGTSIKLLEPAGEGGFGEVWKGQELSLQNYPKDSCFDLRGVKFVFDSPTLEVEWLKSLPGDHVARLVEVHEYSAWQCYALVMPWYETTLSKVLDRYQSPEKRLPAGAAFMFAKTLAIALNDLHKYGAVHRDVKPQNIFLTRGNEYRPDHYTEMRLLLGDFGCTRRWGYNIPHPPTFKTDDGFKAPEVLEVSDASLLPEPIMAPTATIVEPAEDIFALGKVLRRIAECMDRNDYRVPLFTSIAGLCDRTVARERVDAECVVKELCDLEGLSEPPDLLAETAVRAVPDGPVSPGLLDQTAITELSEPLAKITQNFREFEHFLERAALTLGAICCDTSLLRASVNWCGYPAMAWHGLLSDLVRPDRPSGRRETYAVLSVAAALGSPSFRKCVQPILNRLMLESTASPQDVANEYRLIMESHAEDCSRKVSRMIPQDVPQQRIDTLHLTSTPTDPLLPESSRVSSKPSRLTLVSPQWLRFLALSVLIVSFGVLTALVCGLTSRSPARLSSSAKAIYPEARHSLDQSTSGLMLAARPHRGSGLANLELEGVGYVASQQPQTGELVFRFNGALKMLPDVREDDCRLGFELIFGNHRLIEPSCEPFIIQVVGHAPHRRPDPDKKKLIPGNFLLLRVPEVLSELDSESWKFLVSAVCIPEYHQGKVSWPTIVAAPTFSPGSKLDPGVLHMLDLEMTVSANDTQLVVVPDERPLHAASGVPALQFINARFRPIPDDEESMTGQTPPMISCVRDATGVVHLSAFDETLQRLDRFARLLAALRWAADQLGPAYRPSSGDWPSVLKEHARLTAPQSSTCIVTIEPMGRMAVEDSTELNRLVGHDLAILKDELARLKCNNPEDYENVVLLMKKANQPQSLSDKEKTRYDELFPIVSDPIDIDAMRAQRKVELWCDSRSRVVRNVRILTQRSEVAAYTWELLVARQELETWKSNP